MERAEKLPDNGPQGDLHRRLMDRAQADPLIGLSELDSATRAEISMLALTNGWVDHLAKGPSDLWFQLLRIHQTTSISGYIDVWKDAFDGSEAAESRTICPPSCRRRACYPGAANTRVP